MLIRSDRHDDHDQDIADGLSNCVTRDGQSLWTANLPAGGFVITGLGAGSSATDSVRLGQVQSTAFLWGGTASGTANAITLSLNPAPSGYTTGQMVLFKVAVDNTGAVTVNIDGLGAKTLRHSGDQLVGGELGAGGLALIVYDGTDFNLANDFSSSGSFQASTDRLSIKMTNPGSGVGPTFEADRESASPAANDLIGRFSALGRNSNGESIRYGELVAEILSASAGSENGRFNVNTRRNGTVETRMQVSNGVVVGNPSLGDRGVGSLNAEALYVQGEPVDSFAGGTTMVFAQASAPNGWIQVFGLGDRVMRIVSGSGGGFGGSWAISGLSVHNHTLTEAQLPNVTGSIDISRIGPTGSNRLAAFATGAFEFTVSGGANRLTVDRDDDLGFADADLLRYSFGSGNAHSHGISQNGSWRPAFMDVILAAKD